MMGSITEFLLKVALLAPPILFALTVHETAHAVVAWWRGDDTAARMGRISLNPMRHLDLVGTLVFFVTAFMGAGIGWAKPVPVDNRRMKDPHRDIIWVSAAGPAANLLLAVLIALAFKVIISFGVLDERLIGGYTRWQYYLGFLLSLGVQVNVVFAFFNLVPLPPLDGSGIVTGLLPPEAAMRYQRIGRYGIVILLALIVLPSWFPGMPDVIDLVVLTPAQALAHLLLP